jgi:hypothetical protein
MGRHLRAADLCTVIWISLAVIFAGVNIGKADLFRTGCTRPWVFIVQEG